MRIAGENTLHAPVARAEGDSLNDTLSVRAVGQGEAVRATAIGASATSANPAGAALSKAYLVEGTYGFRPEDDATVAGACTTMMKAFFREDYVIPEPVVPSRDGLKLEPWTGEPLTVGGELNKLAFNIAMARDAAGIHWRTDCWDSILLGEQVALGLLREITAAYAEDFGGFELTTFGGQRITVCGHC